MSFFFSTSVLISYFLEEIKSYVNTVVLWLSHKALLGWLAIVQRNTLWIRDVLDKASKTKCCTVMVSYLAENTETYGAPY
jgi:hypothetical protein